MITSFAFKASSQTAADLLLATNEAGQRFWARRGWKLRTDIRRYAFIRAGGDNV